MQLDFTGPTTVVAGTSSTNFTLTPDSSFSWQATLSDGGAGGTFTPPAIAPSSTAQTFVYNAPLTPGIKSIAVAAAVAFVGPPYLLIPTVPDPLNITVLPAGGITTQHLYQFPQQAGVPPFQVLQTNNQLPAANMPYTPPTLVSFGAVEYGSGTLTNLSQSYGFVIVGPFQTTDRIQMRVKVLARGTSKFNLNYEFSTDQGTTWYIGEQKASTASSADDGSDYSQDAHANFNVGYWWRICVYNTDGSTENIAFEWRLHEY
jgi:hypothetical protein